MIDPNLEAMYQHFTTTWDAGKDAIITGGLELRYQGLIYPNDPDRAKYWARLSTLYTRNRQSTLSTNTGVPGGKRYTVEGYIYAQIFGPRNNQDAWMKCQQLAKLAQKALRKPMASSVGNVWFYDAIVENLDPEENWIRFNTMARFTYDEIEA